MAIEYHPKPGQVLTCDFQGNIWPEIIKRRPVVILTPKYAQRADLVAVVPLSTTAPERICDFHCVLEGNPIPDGKTGKIWVKGDLVQTVTFSRLNGIWQGHQYGKRNYLKLFVSEADMLKIRKCVLYGLGFSGLTEHVK